MIPIETLAYISAIIILGLFTSIVAYFLRLSGEVDEKTESAQRKLVERRTEKLRMEYGKIFAGDPLPTSPEKAGEEIMNRLSNFWYDSAMLDFTLYREMLSTVSAMQWDLRGFRDGVFGAIILFSITIFILISEYSSYGIVTFLLGFLVLFYASYKLMRVLSGLRH